MVLMLLVLILHLVFLWPFRNMVAGLWLVVVVECNCLTSLFAMTLLGLKSALAILEAILASLWPCLRMETISQLVKFSKMNLALKVVVCKCLSLQVLNRQYQHRFQFLSQYCLLALSHARPCRLLAQYLLLALLLSPYRPQRLSQPLAQLLRLSQRLYRPRLQFLCQSQRQSQFLCLSQLPSQFLFLYQRPSL
jgi:hypothetical protein